MADDPARWRRLESVVHAALAQPVEARAAFLAEACHGDDELRREAESLLERDGRAEGFLGTPLEALAAAQSRGSALLTGQTIAHYRIVKSIGAGGMGEVYVADDTRLGRQVALKLLPPELASDADRRLRFTREAKAIAALNHPNIVTVFAVEEADGLHFIAMELVRGRTLAELLPPTGFALGQFFEIAIPLADALAAAHQQGITHRDLKPTNLMVSDEGRVTVLDFGLAKAQHDSWNRGGTHATRSLTEEGHFVGTPAYMSPEQAEGAKVDPRSDIFSLGIVFYEMLTGVRPFSGDTRAAITSSILKDAPRPVSELQPAIPRELARLVHRCLAKKPIDRFQSAIDLRHALEEAKQDLDAGDLMQSPRPAPVRRRSIMMPLALLAASLVAVIATALLIGNRDSEDVAAVPRLENPVQVTSSLDVENYPTWSPDGGRVVYQANDAGNYLLGNHDILVAQLGKGESVNLTKGSPANDRRPSWSPDGAEIAFYSDHDGEWGVYIVAAIGGSPRKVLALPGVSASSWSAPQWSKDGTTLFVVKRQSDHNAVIVLSLASLQFTSIPLPTHESPQHWDLSVSPDGRRFAYVEAGGGNPEVGRLWTTAVSGGDPVPLTDGRTKVWSPTWSADGRRVFYVSNRGGSMDLWQQAVDDGGKAVGAPLFVTQGVGMTAAVFSPDGTKLAYAKGGRVSNVWRVPILADRPATWADAIRVTSERAYIEFVDVSPNGQQLALSSDRRGNQDLWLMPSAGGEMTPLTNDPTPDWNPRWSPDGSQIAFYAYRSGNREIWVMPSRGGPARQLTSRPGYHWFPSWSPDGLELAFQQQQPAGNATWIVGANGGEPRFVGPVAATDWSSDGGWLIGVRRGQLVRIARAGGEPVLLPTPHEVSSAHFSRDGLSIDYTVIGGPREQHGIWRRSSKDGRISRLTQLEGQRGRQGYVFSADAHYLYFTWYEDEGDIWVMDVATQTK